MSHPLLEVDFVSLTYPSGVEALKDVSLRLEAGESLALLGRNGSGKTTLSKTFLGLLRPTRGAVRLDGADIADQRPAELAQSIGYVFQDPDDQLFLPKVRDELAFLADQLGQPKADVDARVEAVAAELRLTSFLDAHPFDLGDSLRKLTALASVFVAESPLMVLDEPTSGLSGDQLRLLQAALEARLAAGKSLVLISHDVNFVLATCHRAVVLRDGHVGAEGPVAEVLADPAAVEAGGLKVPFVLQAGELLAAPGLRDPDALWAALSKRLA